LDGSDSRLGLRGRSDSDCRAVVAAKTVGRQLNPRRLTELRHPARSPNL